MRLLAFLTLLPAALLAEGTQGWYQNTIWLQLDERWSVGNFIDLRFDDGVREISTWIVSPRVRYKLNPGLQLQVNASFLESYNADETRRSDWFRLEFELNPTFKLSESLTLTFRDRIEWRWRNWGTDYGYRIRVRPQLNWTINRTGLFRGFYVNNEIFYDFDKNHFTENRLTPLGLTLHPSERMELCLFYLWRTRRGATAWKNYHVFGASASFNY